jgi:hypothetical protein
LRVLPDYSGARSFPINANGFSKPDQLRADTIGKYWPTRADLECYGPTFREQTVKVMLGHDIFSGTSAS